MLDNLSEDQRKVLLMWAFLGVFILIVVYFVTSYVVKEVKYGDKKDKNYSIVKDYNRYYTVTGAINKYYSYLNTKSTDDLFLIINNTYLADNEITRENLLDKIKTYDTLVSYQGSLMCKKQLHTGVVSYYVSGDVVSSSKGTKIDKVFYDVTMDENNMTFDLKEIDSVSFGDECHE